ncbi:MAG: T9SS type A sorting domain-containing protein [Chitinophagales bacterium]|nr:T9SS type A sorting domain-containing protein [Chitinophagales bacterium]
MKKDYLSKPLMIAVMLLAAFNLVNAQTFTVDAPASIAGTYNLGTAAFGPQFTGYSGMVVEATDTDGLTTACVAIDNGVADVTGAVALVDRGGCAFVDKALNAQNAGAIGVIVCNNDTENPDDVITLGGNDGCAVTIPAVMLSYNDCQTIRMETGVMVTYSGQDLPGAGENFATAIDITDGTYTVDSLTGNGGIFNGGDAAAWYTYTAAADGVLRVSSCGSATDTRVILGASPGGCVGDVQVVNFNDDAGPEACADNETASIMETLVFAGQQYYIIWDSRWSFDGFDFTVELLSLPSVDLTFTLNTELESDVTAVNFSYSFNSDMSVTQNVDATDNGDGTWSATIQATTLDTVWNLWAAEYSDSGTFIGELVPGECSTLNGNGTPVRSLVNTSIVDASAATVCYALCTNCPAVNVTYTVDMTNEGASGDGVNLLIGTDIATGDTYAMTDNGDGTWSATVPHTTGDAVGYIFVNGAVDPANFETVPAECGTDSGTGLLVRTGLIEGFDDYAVDAVCFNECGTCPPLGCGTFVIFEDNLDSYVTGSTTGENADWWSTWSGAVGGADDGIVSDDQAASGTNSMLIAEGQTQDVIMLLGDLSSGSYRLDWKTYVPAGATGYYNIQDTEEPGVQWNLNVFYNENGGAAGTGNIMETGTTFTYPEDAWFDVTHIIDLDANTATIIIDGVLVETIEYPGNLGSINFFSIDATNRYYIDDVVYTNLAPVEDVCAGALFAEGLEAYADGSASGPESAVLTTWSGTEGGADDGIVTSEQAHSGCNSMLVAEGQTQDVIFLLGNAPEGVQKVSWWTYVPAGATAYFNIQEDMMPGVQWNMEVYYNRDGGAAGTGEVDNTGTTFSYPEDQWFQVVLVVDLDNSVASLSIDGNIVESAYAYPGAQLGAINFFSVDATNRYYIDDMVMQELPSCNAEVASLICDPVEYSEGPIGPLADHWTTWSGTEGGADDGIVTSEQANTGCSSMLIAEGQTQDVILLLGNQMEGRYSLRWYEYIPAGATGYFNIQEDETPGVQWNMEVYFNRDGGAAGTGEVDNTGTTFTYPEDQWFEVAMIIDLDNSTLELSVDGAVVEAAYAYPGAQLGAINFFSIDATNRYYIDDVAYGQMESAIQQVTASFAVDAEMLINAGELSGDGMFIAGDFTGWENVAMDDGDGDGVWTVDLLVDPNATYEYKFKNGPDGWENIDTSIGDDCTTGGYGNRFIEVADADVSAAEVCFNYCVTCDMVVDVDDVTLESSVAVFPNPAKEVLNVRIDLPEASSNLSVRLMNAFGQVVSEQYLGQLQNGNIEINLAQVPAGAYMLQVRDGQAQYTQSVVVQK